MTECDNEPDGYVPSRTSIFNTKYKIRTENNMDIAVKCFKLYSDSIKSVYDINEHFLNKVLSIEFSSFCENNDSKARIAFDNAAVRCAYLLRYSIVNSVALFRHFKFTDMLKHVERMDTVRICCLGGGTGIEVVGIYLAVSDFLSRCKRKKPALRLCFTVVDICKGFEEWVVTVVKKMRKDWNTTELDVRLRFVKANLTKSWPKEVHEAIQKCDILTMVGLLSSIIANKENRACKKDLKVLSGVVRRMKMDSLFFFLDDATGGHYRRVQNMLMRRQYCEQRQSSLHQCHMVNEKMWEEAMGTARFTDLSLAESRMTMNRSPNLSSGFWKVCVPVLQPSLVGKGKPRSLLRKSSSMKGRQNSGSSDSDDGF